MTKKLELKIYQLNYLVDSLTEESQSEKPNLRVMGVYSAHLRDKAVMIYQDIETELNKISLPARLASEKKVLTGKIQGTFSTETYHADV